MSKKICVFCGARLGDSENYEKVAIELGREIVRRGHSLIYGGGSVGLMGAVAHGVASTGGQVSAVFPRFLEATEQCIQVDGVDVCLVDSMDVRKVKMYSDADAIIVLPGGFGTMDEFFEVLTLKQVGQFDKPIGLLNVNHFYDPLVTVMHHIIEKEFASIENLSFFYDRDNIGDLLDAMNL